MKHVDKYYDAERERHADVDEPPVLRPAPHHTEPLEEARGDQQQERGQQGDPSSQLGEELGGPAQMVGIVHRNEHEGDKVADDVNPE